MSKRLNSKTSQYERLLFCKKDAAALLSISVDLLNDLVLRGELRPTRAGSRVLFSRAELERFAGAAA